MGDARLRLPRARGAAPVLAAGLLSTVVLLWAATTVVGDPAGAGRAALSRLAGEVGDAVVAEWSRWTRPGATPPAVELESLGHWSPGDDGRRADAAPHDLAPAAQGLSAFDALLAEAERLELVESDLPGALELVLEALDKQLDDGRRAKGRLRALQLAARARRADVVAAQWEAVARELHGTEVDRGYSALLKCGLVAAHGLDGEQRGAVVEHLVEAWADGRLALPGPWEWTTAGELVEPLARQRLRQRLVDLADAEQRERLERARQLARRAVVAADLGGLPGPTGGRWRVLARGASALLWRDRGDGQLEGGLCSLARLRAAFVDAVTASGLLPPGFVVDMEGDMAGDAARGEAVREWVALDGESVGFRLGHVDPGAFVQAETRRLAVLRGALVLAALFTLGAAWATGRAWRREARLARLKSTFVANVSHELRTPVSSILLLADNLEAGRVSGAAAAQRYHGLIRREAARLSRLVNDVLDVSRLERGEDLRLCPEPVDLGVWLADLGAELQEHVLRAGGELELVTRAAGVDDAGAAGDDGVVTDDGVATDDCGATADGHAPGATDGGRAPGTAAAQQATGVTRSVGPMAQLDADAVRRAVLNLVDNALKHGGSPLHVELGIVDGQLRVAVRDHGPGIPAGQRRRLLRPFERGSDEVSGAGLGLSIVRAIVEGHLGRLRLEAPASGNGLLAVLELPVLDAATAPVEDRDP